jgi:hypothetical protein
MISLLNITLNIFKKLSSIKFKDMKLIVVDVLIDSARSQSLLQCFNLVVNSRQYEETE